MSSVGVGAVLPVFTLLVPPFALRRGNTLPVFSEVGVGVMLPHFRLLVQRFTLRRGSMLPVIFIRWCRRYAPNFTAVGAAVYAMARVNAARFSAVRVGVMLITVLLLVRPFTLRLGETLPVFRPLV